MAHILIADDEDGFRFLLKRMLVLAGHEVCDAAHGEGAVACLEKFPAQLAIVDLFMPGKEGIETIMEIRQRYPAVKIIAVSGGTQKTGASFLTVAQRLGAHLALSKPFSADELLAALDHLIDSPSEKH